MCSPMPWAIWMMPRGGLLLFQRVQRRSNRTLLKTANPRETLKELMDRRYPTYAEADVTIVSKDVPQEQVATDVIDALLAHLGAIDD